MSKLVLGTVQLGIAYGINNKTSKPDRDLAFSILDTAFEAGIDTFDTAAAYGNAEEVLGAWIAERDVADDVHVISKMRPIKDGGKPTDINASLKRLHLEKLDGYMLHVVSDMEQESVMRGFEVLKVEGRASHIGVSAYTPKEAQEIVRRKFEYVQVPYNVLDRRLDEVGFFEEAKAAGMTVFARAPFLQGLLLMDPEQLPPHVAHAKRHLEKFRSIATSFGLTPLSAALMYVDSHRGIDHIVFGVETTAQLEEILSVYGASDGELVAELNGAFAGVEEAVVDPTKWKKA